MKLHIEFTKPFSDAVGARELEYSFKGSNVNDLLEQLSFEYPGMQKLVHKETGEITEYLLIFLNDRPVSALEGMGSRLSDGDRLFFLFPISGG